MILPPDLTLTQWIALSLIPTLGRRTIGSLLDHFGTLAAIFDASESDLRAVPRIGPKLAAAIRAVDLSHIQQEIAAWQADGITIRLHPDAPLADPGPYPAALIDLPDAPPLLFFCGTLNPEDTKVVAIVGTRRPTPDSRDLAFALAEGLAARGWAVISGLAEGIDTAAHTGALHVEGRTLAVLGSGVRTIYPPGNVKLAARIISGGAVLSETHPNAAPNSPALVARNRLISGLSRAVIVIETGETGGSLHAVRFARQQGRTVYAVENDAAGNQRLIAEGALPLIPNSAGVERFFANLVSQS